MSNAAGFDVVVTAFVAGKRRVFRGTILCSGGWSAASDIALKNIGEVERVSVVCKPLSIVKFKEAA